MLALSVGAFFYVRGHLGVEANTAEMFDPDMPFREHRAALKGAFPDLDDSVLVVVEDDVPEIARRAARVFVERVRGNGTLEAVYWPGDSAFLRRNGLLFKSPAELEAIANRLARSQPFLAGLIEDPTLRGLFGRLEALLERGGADGAESLEPFFEEIETALIALEAGEPHRLSWQRLTRGEGTNGAARELVQIKPVLDYDRILPASEAMEELHAIAAEVEQAFELPVRIRFTGDLALRHEEMQAATRGAIQAGLLALGMVSLILIWGLRSFALIAASLVSLVSGLMLTAGFAAWAVGSINMISIAFAVLYIGLGVDYAIHFCVHYRQERQLYRRLVALERAYHDVGRALALCTVSTAIGFFAFLPTGFDGVAELGLIAGFGMVISFFVSLTLLPAILMLLPFRPPPPKEAPPASSLLSLPQRRPVPMRAFALVLAVGALGTLPWMRFDADPLNLRNPDSESVTTLRALIEADAATPYTADILVPDVEAAARATETLKPLEHVERVVSLLSFVPGKQEEKLAILGELNLLLGPLFFGLDGEAPAPTRNAQLVAMAAFAGELEAGHPLKRRLRAFLERLGRLEPAAVDARLERFERSLLATFPMAMDNLASALGAERVTREAIPADIRGRWVGQGGEFRVRVVPDSTLTSGAPLSAFARAIQERYPEASGDLIVTIASGEVVTGAFRMALLLALVAITALLLAYLRSVRETLLILTPLVLASLLTAATMVVVGIPFNFANVIAIPLLLGFGVDNGIHIIHRARRAAPDTVLLHTGTARAVLLSSVTTLFSFGNLAFSPHQGTATLGWVLTFGVLFTLFATLGLLPALIGRPARRLGES